MTSTTAADWAVEVCRDRVRRAGEIRDTIGSEWAEYMGADEQPRRFALFAVKQTPVGHLSSTH
ncbi:MAG: hypothetical protein QOD10_3964 [Mycobacterium sp.]|jgi:hypothetical protein|nr:hypothetical protein [Mycobacterium sp.]